MLKWFKKIKERFFEDEEEIQYEDDDIEHEQIDENEEIEQVEQPIRRPNFRFPIISDAEIYGWDEEQEEKEKIEERPIVTEEHIDFEPIPLYQHKRWPKQEKMKVHRAKKETPQVSPKQQAADRKQSLHEQFEREVHFNRKERFEPSKVPSPIFGYKKPGKVYHQKRSEHDAQTEINTSNAGHEQSENPTFIDHVKSITSYSSSEEVKREEQHLIDTEKEQQQQQDMSLQEDEVLLKQEDESVQSNEQTKKDAAITAVEVAREAADHEADHSEKQFVEVEECADGEALETPESTEKVEIEEAHMEEAEQKTSLQEVSSEELEVYEQQLNDNNHHEERAELESIIAVGEQEITSNPDKEDDTSTVKEIESAGSDEITMSESPEEQNESEANMHNNFMETIDEPEEAQERIVPFNVLMLKSDKQRLLATQIRDEQLEKSDQNNVASTTTEEQIQDDTPSSNEAVKEHEEVVTEAEELVHYALPSLDYLEAPAEQVDDEEWLASQSEKLEESLSHFGVQATVIEAVQGPTVTSFELTVGQGTKVSRVRNLTDDLKLALAARDIRIQAPIPGKSSIGIEIPNKTARPVRISEVIQSTSFQQSTSPMEAVLGLGLTGEPVTLDLRKMPHGLIAGATGSGKSVCINSILVSLLYKASPVDVKMMLIDPKMVELAPYNGIPHLISPVITDVKAATAALKWAVQEMGRRYELLAHAGVRNIEAFNKQADEHRQFAQKMPYLLIVIDELADLMMMAPADVEISISRIAQKARACGIHLIIATQRPSVDVITGIIKANIPTRIAFSVSSQVDSRTMIDTNGAERLLGKGDMLYIGNGESTAVRLQGTFVTDDEIDRIIEHVQNEASPNYLFGQDELLKSAVEEDEDPLFLAACEFIYAQDSASTSMLQRNFSIGYNRAAKLMDRLEDLGFISPQQGSKARDVYLTAQDLSELKETVL